MIQPKDNSDNSWMVIADWMEDNDFVGANELRESISKPIISNWEYEYRFIIGGAVGGGSGGVGGGGVGGVDGGDVGDVGVANGVVGSGVDGGDSGVGSGVGSGVVGSVGGSVG